MFVFSTLGGILFIKFRKVEDPFYIKRELLFTLFILFPPTVLAGVSSSEEALGSIYSYDFDYGTLFLLILPSVVLSLFSLGYITLLATNSSREGANEKKILSASFRSRESAFLRKSIGQLRNEFSLVLANPQYCREFESFLQREWSIENLLFWKDCILFRETFSGKDKFDPKLQESVGRIINEYISNNAPLCVNLAFETKKAIFARMESKALASDMFEDAEEEILLLMLRDSFRRFQSQNVKMTLEIQSVSVI
jgi:hypothetical protein